jgi:hypothetical protein
VTLRRFEVYSFEGPDQSIEAFAEAARDCARFIPEVLHSAIGRFRSSTPLNFVWEQAYASPDAYRRYMEHPYHAARLDRHLMIDSPECIATDNGLGVGLIGYTCEDAEYFLERGARRVLGLSLAPGAEREFERMATQPGTRGGALLSLFKENTFGPRWFDGETVIGPPPIITHIWELGYESLQAAQAHEDAWRDTTQDLVQSVVEIVYEIQPGYGYYG